MVRVLGVSSVVFLVVLAVAAIAINGSTAYVSPTRQSRRTSHWHWRRDAGRRLGPNRQQDRWPLFSDPNDDSNFDPNRWISSDDESSLGDASWEESLARRDDGSLWSSFASSDGGGGGGPSDGATTGGGGSAADADGGEEAWLDALASIAAEEVEFMSKEADRADKARQMQEMGFSEESISSTLGVATDEELETDESNAVFEAFKDETAKTGFGLMVDDDVDMETVESHTQVAWDSENDEPVRAQHVYVDEVTCIGCTNCAMIAQSTFFMESEHGRARVFQQWGGENDDVLGCEVHPLSSYIHFSTLSASCHVIRPKS